jgi:hypothetical protein
MHHSQLYDVASPKTVVTRPSTTAYMCINSADRLDPNVSAEQNQFQRYNDFVITKNQNLLQGAFTRIQLTDVRFPYSIPNINPRNNKFYVLANSADIADVVLVTIPEGFYTGSALAAKLQSEIITTVTTANPPGSAGIANLLVEYDVVNEGEFSFAMTVGTGPYSFALYPYSPNIADLNESVWISTNQLLKTIGLDYFNGTTDLYTIPIVGGTAPMLYTDYIDITSQQLTNYQRVKDNSTTRTVPRQAIVERLFINNETSQTTPPNIPGTYPFIIYRQIKNPKTIRWSGEHSIGQIDIQLYDMFGEPLYVPTQTITTPLLRKGYRSTTQTIETPQPNFQLTFLASED